MKKSITNDNDAVRIKTPRFYELDLLRFLAALAVVFFHYTFLNATEMDAIPSYPVLGDLFKYGYLGVELFFIISGFVILMTAENNDWRKFVISRVARLYPAFWIAVTLTTIFILLIGIETYPDPTLSQYLLNLTMLGELINVQNIDPVYWTLQVELKFYFWIFFILLIKKLQYIEYFIFTWLIISVLEIFHFFHDFTHPLLMPEWAPYFSSGAIFYYVRKYGLNWQRGGMIILAYLLSTYYAIEGANERTDIYGNLFSPVVVATIISVFYFIFTMIALNRLKPFCMPWFRNIGSLTYPLYLIHQTIGFLVFYYLGTYLDKYILLVLITLVMMLLALLIHQHIEIGWGKKMRKYLQGKLNTSRISL